MYSSSYVFGLFLSVYTEVTSCPDSVACESVHDDAAISSIILLLFFTSAPFPIHIEYIFNSRIFHFHHFALYISFYIIRSHWYFKKRLFFLSVPYIVHAHSTWLYHLATPSCLDCTTYPHPLASPFSSTVLLGHAHLTWLYHLTTPSCLLWTTYTRPLTASFSSIVLLDHAHFTTPFRIVEVLVWKILRKSAEKKIANWMEINLLLLQK